MSGQGGSDLILLLAFLGITLLYSGYATYLAWLKPERLIAQESGRLSSMPRGLRM